MSETLARVKILVGRGDVHVSRHGFRELAADDILLDDIMAGVETAVAIEDYPTSRKEPAVLVLQRDRHGRPIHGYGAFQRIPARRRCW